MAKVFIPTQLRRLTGGTDRIAARGSTVGDLIDDIERAHPGFRAAVVDRGDLSASLAVSVDGAITSGGLLEPVLPESEVHFVPALGGG
jgi:molybdopterin synthase sulfur carrier subunit